MQGGPEPRLVPNGGTRAWGTSARLKVYLDDEMLAVSGGVCVSGTARQERAIDYWTRHCSLRPRDAIVIGKEISLIGVKRRNQQEIRNAINTAAAERVETLFNEVSPFFSGLYPEIFPQVIKSNVLTYDEVIEASIAYADIAARQYETETEAARHPFCALYALGLVGIVQQSRDDPARLVQKFAPVGEIAFGKIHVLPHAETYLIHPSLSDFITRRNVGFLKELNKHNVIGDELEWRPEESIRFVAVGDIRGYRENGHRHIKFEWSMPNGGS